jgi:hypothetical protein
MQLLLISAQRLISPLFLNHVADQRQAEIDICPKTRENPDYTRYASNIFLENSSFHSNLLTSAQNKRRGVMKKKKFSYYIIIYNK